MDTPSKEKTCSLSLFTLATFSYVSFTTIANVLPSDVYKNDSVATVSGFSGTGAALGTIIVFEFADHLSGARIATGTHLFDPLMVIAGLIPFCRYDPRAPAGAQYKGGGRGPRSPNLKFRAQVGCQPGCERRIRGGKD